MDDFIEWVKDWYNLAIAEQQEMWELGDSYEKRYFQLKGRVVDLSEEIKKRKEIETKNIIPIHSSDRDSSGKHFEDE